MQGFTNLKSVLLFKNYKYIFLQRNIIIKIIYLLNCNVKNVDVFSKSNENV